MFLSWRRPTSRKGSFRRFLTARYTSADTVIPPGGASAWMRAAMLMLSPKSPASVRTTSPRWMPMRMRSAFGRPCESAASRVWIATAASTASTALWKSATKQSPSEALVLRRGHGGSRGGSKHTGGATARRRPVLARLQPRVVGERGLHAMADWRALTDTVLVHGGSLVTLGLLALAGLVHRLAPAEESRRGGVAVWMLAAALVLRLAGTVTGA